MQRRVPVRWLRAVEIAAFGSGAALLLLYAAARIGADAARAQGVEAFREARTSATREADPAASRVANAPFEASQIDQSLWSQQRVRAFEKSRGMRDAPRAVLRIPSLELEVPVYGDTSELNLSRGAGHVEGTAPLGAVGNAGVAAHRDGFFRKLERIGLGAEIVLDVPGEKVRYRVSSIEIVLPTDVHVLADGTIASITLVTCYPFYFLGAAPQRYIVRGDLVEMTPAAGS